MSEGLAPMMHESVAPSDDELIAELESEMNKAEAEYETRQAADRSEAAAKRAEYEEKLKALDEKPEVEVKGERGAPITEEDVAGDKAGETTAPDRTLLRDKLVELYQTQEQAPEEPALSPEAQVLQKLAELQEQQLTGKTAAQRAAAENTPEAIARKAYEAAQKAQAEAQRYREELAERERERRIEALENSIVEYVTAQGDKYPLVNDGNQKLVPALMFQSIQDGEPISEDEALAQVESKLSAYVQKAAARLGWTPPGEQSNAGASSKGSQVAETSLTKENVGAPAPRGARKAWDEMSDDERDAALIELL